MRKRGPSTRQTRIYFFHQDEVTDEIEEMNPRKLNKNLMKYIFKKLNIENKARWSRKAGCSCSCSPGFILEGHSIFVDIIAN